LEPKVVENYENAKAEKFSSGELESGLDEAVTIPPEQLRAERRLKFKLGQLFFALR
jgi:hypothetical protein